MSQTLAGFKRKKENRRKKNKGKKRERKKNKVSEILCSNFFICRKYPKKIDLLFARLLLRIYL